MKFSDAQFFRHISLTSGIKTVVYLSDEKHEKDQFKASREILKAAKVEQKSFKERCKAEKDAEILKRLILDFRNGTSKPDDKSKAKQKDTGRKRIPWEQFFMGLARISGEVRSIATKKEGACIVNPDKRIVGLGYVDDSLFHKMEEPKIEDGDLYMTLAPMNAIVNKSPTSLNGCTMYVTHFPTNECAKVIVQSGITKVVFLEDKLTSGSEAIREATIRMFDLAHVDFEEYKAEDKHREISLDFAERTQQDYGQRVSTSMT